MTKQYSASRQTTEHKILLAVADIIAEHGFENIGINIVAERAGISKVLIYRYFGSLEQLIANYIFKCDYWTSIEVSATQIDNIRCFLKNLFAQQIAQLRHDIILKRLTRWELSTNNQIIMQLRQKREKNGCDLVELVSQLTQTSSHDVAALATILSSSISYLVMISDVNPCYNGIQLQTDDGWQQIQHGIDMIIDLWLDHLKNIK